MNASPWKKWGEYTSGDLKITPKEIQAILSWVENDSALWSKGAIVVIVEHYKSNNGISMVVTECPDMCSPHYWHGACVWSSSFHMLWEAVMEGCSPGLQDYIDHFLWSSARGIFDSIVFIYFSSVFLLKRKRKRFKDQWKRRFYALSKQMFSNNVIFEPFIQKWTSFKCWNQNSKSWKRF